MSEAKATQTAPALTAQHLRLEAVRAAIELVQFAPEDAVVTGTDLVSTAQTIFDFLAGEGAARPALAS